MHKAVERLRERMHPVDEGRYIAGLSGGADSVALMMLLLPDVQAGKIRLEAVHVNHGLRGSESDGDERFCRELCEREHIAFASFRADLGGRKDEAAAREARFGLFRKQYTACGADGLILAHNADDQAETFLMRLTRGTGPEGLECMRHDETLNGIRILRPLLTIRRDEIRKVLEEDGIPWREDSTNSGSVYLRNRIRHELIPALEKFSGSAVEKICRTAEMTAEDNDALNDEAERLMERFSHGREIDAEGLAGGPAALRKRVLRKWWAMNSPALKEHALSAEQTGALDSLLREARGKINLPGGQHAVRTGRYLFLTGGGEENTESAEYAGSETVFGSFRLTESRSEGNPGDGKTAQEVPRDFCRGCIIRTRRPGDRIRPFGCKGSRKLQDYLTDRRIEEPFRDRIPLLCRGSEVLLVCGVGAGAVPAWDPQDHPVRLTWHGDMPWANQTGE